MLKTSRWTMKCALISSLLTGHAAMAATLSVHPQGLIFRSPTSKIDVTFSTSPARFDLLTEVYEYQPDGTVALKPLRRETNTYRSDAMQGNATVTVQPPHPGLYMLSITQLDESGKELARTSVSFAQLLPTKNEPLTDFGVVTHFGQFKGLPELTLPLVAEAGFGRIRDELPWDQIEKKPGNLVFPPLYDQYLDVAYKNKLKPLIVLDYGNSHAYPTLFGGANGNAPKTQRQMDLFGAYVSAVVSRYKHIVTEWEIWNEPKSVDFGDDKWIGYTAFAKLVAGKIRAEDANATIIACGGGGTGGGPGGACVAPMLQAGAGSFVDGFSIHPYMAPYDPDNGYPAKNSPIPRVNFSNVAPSLHGLLVRWRASQPPSLWATEIGWSSAPANARISETIQAAYISRLLLEVRRYTQIKATFWYDFQNDGVNPTNAEQNFGLIRGDYSPKPAYLAVATTAATIRNLPWVAALIDTASAKAYVYGNDRSVIAAWTTSPGEQTVTLPVKPGRYVLRDWRGEESVGTVNNGNLAVKINSFPVFVVRTQ